MGRSLSSGSVGMEIIVSALLNTTSNIVYYSDNLEFPKGVDSIMANITTPEFVPITTNLNGCHFPLLEQINGNETHPVGGNGVSADHARHESSEDTTREEESSDELPDDDELPPVYQFPIVRTVRVRFIEIGRLQPLPFPESDD